MTLKILNDFWIDIRAIVIFIGVLLWILPSSIFRFPPIAIGLFFVLAGIAEIVEYFFTKQLSPLFWGGGFLVCGITVMAYSIIKKHKKESR
ncbi:MAG: hypothetical protein LBG66_05830 [Gallionellaceae bacterium]|jgi:uncharacterized membrane protein HdeD (DUF308 family)|nr:hypothetical protein [Gallionellaceae bacterium]